MIDCIITSSFSTFYRQTHPIIIKVSQLHLIDIGMYRKTWVLGYSNQTKAFLLTNYVSLRKFLLPHLLIAGNDQNPIITSPERMQNWMYLSLILVLSPFPPFSEREQTKILTSQKCRADKGTRIQDGDIEDKAWQRGKKAGNQSPLGQQGGRCAPLA